jgi:uncharacterized membrane protein SpoIIM required for sporulation
MAFVVARREIRDSFRDWRIIIPIILLTAFFPTLMNFTAGRLVAFVEDYGAEIIATQLIPFLLLVVGFFPMSFSLVIALETFVGERERKSLEPLLATPLTDFQLYMGKMLAALVPPLLASYLGMAVYMIGLYSSLRWLPTPQLFVQSILITTAQGVIMVAAAVVVSSQTTSVRAANLLASFIIVPMALLIQAEAAALFWGNHSGLWWLILGLIIAAAILMRMGLRIFSREELMGNEIDQIRLGWIFRQFWQQFSGKREVVDGNGRVYPRPLTWYKQTLAILPKLKLPMAAQLIAMIATIIASIFFANKYALPAEIQSEMTGDNIASNLSQVQIYIGALPTYIFFNNVRVMALQALLGLFSFGVLCIFIFMLPWGIIGYVAGQFALAGENPWLFVLTAVVPHAIVELPAILIAAAAALRWHATIISPPPERTLSEGFIWAAADYARLFVGVVVPLLLIAALVESFVTPLVLMRVYGS